MENQSTDPDGTGPGVFRRYIQVFISPDSLFRGLRTQPDWVGAVLLGGFLAALGAVLLPPELTFAAIREQALARGQALPPGFADQIETFRYFGLAAAFVFWGVYIAILSGVVMGFFAFLAGHEGTYRQYFAVVAHAQLVPATATVLMVPLRIAAEDAQLLLSLGAFAVFLEPSYLLRLLSYLDLFGLWSWVLVGLGVARIARKESWALGVVIVMVIPVTIAAVLAVFTG
jgi:hypothetical protein